MASLSRTTRARIVFAIGIFAYTVAVWQRTTLGVAGIEAADRLGTAAGVVSTFAVLQLIVYAGLQVPVGVLLDAFGSRVMVAAGAVVMGLGEVSMAFADTVPEAAIARVLVGAGDAMTFACVIRLIPAWFSTRRVPLLTQLTSLTGQTGQAISAVPFIAYLDRAGWTPAFLAASTACFVSAVLAAAFLRDSPSTARPLRTPLTPRQLREDVLAVVRHPGTRLAVWTHWATGFAPIVFAMMWGFPYLVAGEGLPGPTASALITVFVVAGLVFGPTLGTLTQRHPYRRTNLAMLVALFNAVPWLAVLLWPGPAPLWLLVVLVVGLASGGPGSAIGLDLGRTFTSARRLGTATGIVIMGAFTAALASILVIGLTLDLISGGDAYTLRDFRLAMSTQLVFFAIGMIGVVRTRRVIRARTAASGVAIAPLPTALKRKAVRTWQRPRR